MLTPTQKKIGKYIVVGLAAIVGLWLLKLLFKPLLIIVAIVFLYFLIKNKFKWKK